MAQHTFIENVHRNTEDWLSTKAAVRGKGVDCPDDTPTANVAGKIEEIETGGGGYSDETVGDILRGSLKSGGGYPVFVFPESAYEIKEKLFAFSGGNISELDIPDNIERIKTEAFRGCNSLQKITIRSVANNNDEGTDVQYGAFDSYKEDDQPYFYPPLQILVILGTGAMVLGDNAFRGQSNLHTIVFKNKTVFATSTTTFSGCTGITDFYYGGTETEFNQIKRNIKGITWENVTLHYNYTGDGSEFQPEY